MAVERVQDLLLRTEALIGHVDELGDSGGRFAVAPTAARGGFLTIRGWLFDRVAQRSADSIAIRLNTDSPVEAVIGLERPDVGEALGAGAAASGFAAAVPILAACGPGSLWIESRVGDRTNGVGLTGVLRIVDAPDPFAGGHPRPDGWAFSIDGVVDESGEPLAAEADGAWIIPADAAADVRLWVLDAQEMLPPQAIVARIGGRLIRFESTIERPDVAASFGAPAARMCGFTVPLMPLPIGTERIDIYAVDQTGGYARLGSVRVRRPAPLPSAVLPASASIDGAIDGIRCGMQEVAGGGPISARPGDAVRLRGWTIDTLGPRLCGGIEVLLDGRTVLETQTDIARPDIVALTGNCGLADCGFEFSYALPPALASGTHDLAIRVFSARRDSTALLASRRLSVP